MSCKQKSETTLFLLVAVYFYTFRVCHSVSLGRWGDGFSASQGEASTATREKIKQDDGVRQGNWHLVEKVILGTNLRKVTQELRPESAVFPGEPLPYLIVPKLDETGSNFAANRSSWSVGKISTEPRSSALDSEDGYQADFTGFHGVQGKVLGPSFDSSPHFSEWLAMRPLVQCDENVMTFTASGQGLTHLLVDREGASPISLLQLPPYCGYSVRTSWSDLEMMVPYDACYITQENDSYVLPLLWGGSPLKLSCPVQMSTPAPSSSLSAPSVFCSPYGMAVQMHGQEQDIVLLGVIVNGGWGPFVSEECAYRVHSRPTELTFFISYKAACITSGEGLHLHLLLDDHEYILSCPVNPQFPSLPDPVSPAPTAPPPPPPPPQPPTKEPTAQLPDYPYYPYPGLQYPQLPQLYPPGPQPVHPPKPTKGSPPGPQPQPQQQQQQQQQQSLYPMGPGKLPYSPGEHPKYPSPPYQSPVAVQATSTPNLSPLSLSQYQYGLFYPHMPLYYPAVTPPPTPAAKKTTTTTVPPATDPPRPPANPYDLQYYLQMPYYPAPSAAPVTQASAPLPPSPPYPPPLPAPPKQPEGPQYKVGPFHPHSLYSSYYPYGPISYPKPGLEFPFHPQIPTYFLPPTPLPPGKEMSQAIPQEPQKPAAPQANCPPYTNTLCSYYSYPYYPYYHPFYQPHYHPHYPPVPQYPEIEPPVATKKPFTTTTTTLTPTTASTTMSAATEPTPEMLHLKCLMGRMVVFLPFAHPDSIQVRDQMKAWLFLSSVSPLCGYMLQMAEGSGVILHSPLPACHSQSRTPTTISLPLRFWDLSMARTTLSPVLKPRVICSSHQMTVELPSGSTSGILLKDIKGNWMNLQDAPKHCGYSASKGKNGKIHLSLQLHSRCHMSVQGKMYIITVVYMTVDGRREAQFSCPIGIPGPGKECNLPSDQRLPCGPASVSQPQCLSMGCCFSKHPPACYYPMDECTIDRHFVFSVPASLTEPPLSPALLVAASNSTCRPQRVTSDYALFKIPMDGCGARRVRVGKVVIYMVEIINKVQAISLNYGTITRDSPVRLLVECRFQPGTVLTVSYLVKTPTLGPEVHTQGMFGVQLRIAKDSQYNSYHPQYHQPLQMLLGKPLYLEVRLLNAPDPSLVLLVHFCVAYPRSGKSVWVLLYNGCPNPLDPAPQQAVVSKPRPPFPQGQTRRFTISTFQFLPDGEFKDPEEEIYFMCSTEICSPRDGPCVEGCFGQ
uniref:ZP domain-containing protein n=1 Tax=Seriola dumerili TaxID=41447 RepID=A0A3B4TIR4_SERDU